MRPIPQRAPARFLLDRSGSIQIMGAFMIFVAMGIGAVSVDLIAVQNTSERLEVAADLTCERIQRADNSLYRTSSDLATAAQQFLNDQLKNDPLNVEARATVVVTDPEKSGRPIDESELQVTIRGDVETIMAKFVGLDGSQIDVVRICNPKPVEIQRCTEAQKAFYVMTSASGERVPLQRLRDLSRLSRDAFVMTLTDQANDPILRQTVTNDMTIGTSLGGRTLLPTDRLHFQPSNADGTLPDFCPGVPVTTPTTCTGPSCNPPTCTGPNCNPPTCTGPNCNPTTCTGPSCPPTRDPGGGRTCDPRTFYKDDKKVDSTEEDSHYDPRATRQWISTNGRLTRFYYRGLKLYKSNEIIEFSIPIATKFTRNMMSPTVQVEYKTMVNGKQQTRSMASTIENIFLSKLKAQNDRTLPEVLSQRLKLVFVRDKNKALWEAPDGTCVETDSPIVLALDGRNSIRTTGTSTSHQALRIPGDTVRFDVHGTGRELSTEWIVGDGGQALLVDNRDGRAAEDMNGNRLFGSRGAYQNGYQKLRKLDTSGTGVLRGSDLDGLAAWIDDGDAVVDPGELVSLHDLGITELGTEIVTVQDDKGFDLMRSWAVRNGQVIMTEDVWFAVTDREVAAAPEDSIPTRN
jgi:hypothetical protein